MVSPLNLMIHVAVDSAVRKNAFRERKIKAEFRPYNTPMMQKVTRGVFRIISYGVPLLQRNRRLYQCTCEQRARSIVGRCGNSEWRGGIGRNGNDAVAPALSAMRWRLCRKVRMLFDIQALRGAYCTGESFAEALTAC